MFVILAFGKLKQEDCFKSEASLGCYSPHYLNQIARSLKAFAFGNVAYIINSQPTACCVFPETLDFSHLKFSMGNDRIAFNLFQIKT